MSEAINVCGEPHGCSFCGCHHHTARIAELVRDVAEREAAARKAALVDAINAVCIGCRQGEPLVAGIHTIARGGIRNCVSGAIRSLMQPGDTA